jgi:hypothetical protein
MAMAENLSVTAAANNQLQGGYAYDAAGNMMRDATGNLNYTYDQENRISGAAGFTYTYDADGNRVEKANATTGTGTLYWYMSLGIVGESDLTGNLQSEYIFFDGERVARKDYPGNAVSYYFSDHLKTAISNRNRITTPGAANSSSPTTTPIITSSPAKNGMLKPDWIILGRGIIPTASEDSLRPTGRLRRSPSHTLISPIRNRSIGTRTCATCPPPRLMRTAIVFGTCA